VWHEYTHGLSGRLITDADGVGAVNSAQAGAMGEGWSDWYAVDLMSSEGMIADTAASGEADLGVYTDPVANMTRWEPLDCPAGAPDPAANCVQGYTYADFGRIASGPQVHADGEIWGETLWDLRAAVGGDEAQRLITDGMRQSPPEPSFLDARNAILTQAITPAQRAQLWEVFRARGMGYKAQTTGGGDVSPTADFSPLPAP
jgi:hypothetical protein